MPTAFPSVSADGAQSLSLISQNSSPRDSASQSQTVRSIERENDSPRTFHRIAEVRQQQNLSLRTVSRRTGVEVKELRRQEAASSDLLLSELLLWQKALDVPLVDLL